MSNSDQTPASREAAISGGAPETSINPLIIGKSAWAFRISLISFIGFLFVLFLPPIIDVLFDKRISTGLYLGGGDVSMFFTLMAYYLPHLLLFTITMASAYIGYKLVVASGASPENPIPAGNYRLLSPLISDGKAESIDQYVRLSSLSGFTGTFTKLGLTGLPLTTVMLTLIFAALSLLPIDADGKKNFIDLTKLTLGAFIGSFVQRQVEQRRVGEKGPGSDRDQSRAIQP
jgi:hypothetical protein